MLPEKSKPIFHVRLMPVWSYDFRVNMCVGGLQLENLPSMCPLNYAPIVV